MMTITKEIIIAFESFIVDAEKSESTQSNYLRCVKRFAFWLGNQEISKKLVLEYKELMTEKYKIATVNGIISALNSFFDFLQMNNLKVKTLKKQKEIFCSKEKELSKSEYERLLDAALSKGDKRLFYIMQTICSTGIRISELKFVTVQAIKDKYAEVRCKGKNRIVILPNELCESLKRYAHKHGIVEGCIFTTKSGKAINRSNVWNQMKKLCTIAKVLADKVFPHNLRHLFARTYYSLQKDVVRLADILGHSSINTTRIYTLESGDVHRRQIQKLGLVVLRE